MEYTIKINKKQKYKITQTLGIRGYNNTTVKFVVATYIFNEMRVVEE